MCYVRFSEGRNDMVVDMYEQFYQNNHINHWTSSSPSIGPSSPPTPAPSPSSIISNSPGEITFEMDLHEFSRGMAYAAIKVALREV